MNNESKCRSLHKYVICKMKIWLQHMFSICCKKIIILILWLYILLCSDECQFMSHHFLIVLLRYHSENLKFFSWNILLYNPRYNQYIFVIFRILWFSNPRKIPFSNILFMGGLKYMYWFTAFDIFLLCSTILNSVRRIVCFSSGVD